MKSKLILQEHIQKYLKSQLEALDFKYAKSGPKFSREKNKFKTTISFSISKYSSEEECIFWSIWDVSSKEYTRWYEQEWGEKPANNLVISTPDWNISGWRENEDHTTIYSDFSSVEVNFNDFINNVLKVGIPYIEQISSWEAAAKFALDEPIVFYDKVFDFYLIANEKEKAKEVLEVGIEKLNNYDELDLLPELVKRKKRYFKI
ncbi:hypothetical protein U8Y98_27470 [Priestia megaterium]|uniref:hypothetical protein n=1 Tax=Priestia megaterium TaxID=1404 RepID=UPI002FE07827